LIAELVGRDGSVTTVDIDPEVCDRARTRLDAAGYGRVRVLRADAEHGVSDRAPFDRTIVTVGAWDIPPAWIDQLTDAGRIVVPLRFAGITRLVGFDRSSSGGLVSHSYRLVSFVPMQGEGSFNDTVVPITEDVVVIRSLEQIGHFFHGLELLEPALVPLNRWRPDPATSTADVDEFCAVGRKP
jgi:protein-L-isoaspartate(D-aspartate) O-methyltransferase